MKILILVFSLFTVFAFSQSKTAKGFVYDEESKQPIPYVNISIIESSNGTSSDDDGSFELTISETDFNKQVHVSSLGYKDSIISVEKLIKSDKIFLKAKIEQLNEVVISKKFEEKFLIINSFKKNKIRGNSFVTGKNPWIIALFFPYKEEYSETTNLNSIKIHIDNKSFFSPKPFPSKFRVRLFSLGNDELPGNDMISENIIVETKIKQKIVDLDISEYNLTFPKEGFFIALEWLYIPFNEYIDTYRTKTEKNHKELRYAPRFSFSEEKIGSYKTAIFASGKWYEFPRKLKNDTEMIPAISLTLSN